jgi:hypothetical protein
VLSNFDRRLFVALLLVARRDLSLLKANTYQVQSQQAILSIAARTPIDLLSIVFCLVPADPSDSIRHQLFTFQRIP